MLRRQSGGCPEKSRAVRVMPFRAVSPQTCFSTCRTSRTCFGRLDRSSAGYAQLTDVSRYDRPMSRRLFGLLALSVFIGFGAFCYRWYSDPAAVYAPLPKVLRSETLVRSWWPTVRIIHIDGKNRLRFAGTATSFQGSDRLQFHQLRRGGDFLTDGPLEERADSRNVLIDQLPASADRFAVLRSSLAFLRRHPRTGRHRPLHGFELKWTKVCGERAAIEAKQRT